MGDARGTQRPPVVELVQVGRRFDGLAPVDALRDINMVVRHNEYVAITGPSGSGKSTLLHLLGLLDRPTSGTYRVDGVDTSELSQTQRAGLRGRQIGFVFQEFHLLPHRSVLENVMLGLVYGSSVPRKQRHDLAAAALRRVGLAHRMTMSPATLSGGERQRVAVARALVPRRAPDSYPGAVETFGDGPSLLLADEPTGNLDSRTSAVLLDLFDELHAAGLTLVVITHDDDVSRRAQRQVRLVDGRIAEVLTRPA